jgi:hypothetical protein
MVGAPGHNAMARERTALLRPAAAGAAVAPQQAFRLTALTAREVGL